MLPATTKSRLVKLMGYFTLRMAFEFFIQPGGSPVSLREHAREKAVLLIYETSNITFIGSNLFN